MTQQAVNHPPASTVTNFCVRCNREIEPGERGWFLNSQGPICDPCKTALDETGPPMSRQLDCDNKSCGVNGKLCYECEFLGEMYGEFYHFKKAGGLPS